MGEKIWEKLREELLCIDKLQEFKEEAREYNRATLHTVCLIGGCLSFILAILSLPGIAVLELSISYAILTVLFGIVFILSDGVFRTHKKCTLPVYYILITFLLLLAVYMGTVLGASTNATTFLMFLLLMPMFAIDIPLRIICLNIVMTLIFIRSAIEYKESQEILSADITNAIVFCFISIVFVLLTVNRELRVFEMKRKEKEKMEQKDSLINAIPAGIAIYEVLDDKVYRIFQNDGFFRLFEDDRDSRWERCKGDFFNTIHPDDYLKVYRVIRSMVEGKDFTSVTCRAIKGDGTYMWIQLSSSVAERKQGFIRIYSTYASVEEEMKSKQATQAKTDFLSRMSHDIRTPMNAIIGMTNLAREEANLDTIHEYLDHIDSSSQFLLGLINDILDLSKIESGEFKLHPEPYHQDEFDTTINTIIRPMIENKHIEFVYNMGCGTSCLFVDKLRLNQIFLNLLSNAAKFTPENGKVEFLAEHIPDRGNQHGIRFIVRDNGIGMSQEFLKNLFVPFVQDKLLYDTQSQGTGLGLPIVKSLVDAMGGAISVKSELGKGTEYFIDLYLPIATKEQEESEQEISTELLEGAEILLVEDNDMNILVAQRILESKGCHVTIAKNGKDALDLFTRSEVYFYDAILMDVRMPIMNGLTATQEIRKLERPDAEGMPIIAMTADAFREEQSRTIEAGMNYHLAKPVNPKQLFETLTRFIQRNQKSSKG